MIRPPIKLVDANTRQVETRLRPAAFLEQGSTPLSFLVGVMNDPDSMPRQRIKAAQVAARYKNIPGEVNTSAFIIDDPFGFSCDIAIAREIRQLRARLRYMDRLEFGIRVRPYTSGDIKEARIIRERLAELKSGLKYCPTYKKADRSSDFDRMMLLNSLKVPLSTEEDVELSYLWARTLSYRESPREAAAARHSEFRGRRMRKDLLTAAEETELREIERRYPHLRLEGPHGTDLLYPYGFKDDYNQNLKSGMSNFDAFSSALQTASKRFCENPPPLEGEEKTTEDEKAAVDGNQKLATDNEKRNLTDNPASVMRDKQPVLKQDDGDGTEKPAMTIDEELELLGFKEFSDE